jgi:hypothetical protein
VKWLTPKARGFGFTAGLTEYSLMSWDDLQNAGISKAQTQQTEPGSPFAFLYSSTDLEGFFPQLGHTSG